MIIRQARSGDLDAVTKLTLLLFTSNSYEDLLEENQRLLLDDSQTVFLLFDGKLPAGFAHCSLRNDYVEGTSGGTVGYLEGIFILPEYRRKGLAKSLVTACENWAKERGCKEIASDCELSNTGSYDFHIAVGFEDVNRVICFSKEIGAGG